MSGTSKSFARISLDHLDAVTGGGDGDGGGGGGASSDSVADLDRVLQQQTEQARKISETTSTWKPATPIINSGKQSS
jgi:hypothetical protein